MIKKKSLLLSALFLGLFILTFGLNAFADDEAEKKSNMELTVEPAPLDYASVSGDTGKFRENNWRQEGYDGGFDNLSFEEKNLPENVSATVDGHALIRNNDYEVNALVKKPDFGYVKLEYQEFSKYYDNTGGVYDPFPSLEFSSLNRDLELEVGRLRVETGITIEDMPQISVAYERHFKDGTKSMPTWTPVTSGGLVREIGPSFEYIDEITDSVELNEEYTIREIELKGSQYWEWSHAEIEREEASLSSTATASDKKIRLQQQNPEAHLFSTTESAEQWFKNDTMFAGTAYHFMMLKNDELENIFEMNQNGAVTNFSNPKQIRNARADNEYNSHVWTGSFMFTPLNWMNVTSKLRTELDNRSGNSSYPSDSTPAAAGGANPDGIINTTELSRTEDRVGRIGESVSVRVTKIERTVIYNDFEFEQTRNWLSEDRDSIAGQSVANAGEIFGRETINSISRGIWTIGAQILPVKWLDWTSHFRVNRSNADYDDTRETVNTATGAKSAFMDSMNIGSHEMATRWTFKPKPWLRPSVGYQYRINHFFTRVEDLETVETGMASHIFSYNMTLQPLDSLLVVTGVSPQYASVTTPARNLGNGGPPRFQANILSWILNSTYDLTEKVGLNGGLEYSHANNYVDFSSAGLPMGSAFSEVNFSSGVTVKLTKQVSLSLDYGFLHYNGNAIVDAGDYDAHMFSIHTKFEWA